jgi:hypothetical protein
MEIQPRVQELQEQELPQQALVQLAEAQALMVGLEVRMKALVEVMVQVEAEVLDLALALGLRQAVLEQGQVVLVQAPKLEALQLE